MPDDTIVPPYEVPNAEKDKDEYDAIRAGQEEIVTHLDHVDPQGPIPENKKYVLERIGHVPYAPGGPYSGCKMIQFTTMADTTQPVGQQLQTAVDQFNDFFVKHGNLLVVEQWVSSDGNVVTAMVTNQMNDAQLRVFNTRADIIEKAVKELMKEEDDKIAEQEKAVTTEHQRLVDMAKVGDHCLHNHGALTKQMREKMKIKGKK